MRMQLASVLVLAALGLAACSGGNNEPASSGASASPAASGSGSASGITGAGGTFPQPIYTQWAQDYAQAAGEKVNYQGIGSSGGIKQIQAKTVDFGASDAPMSKEDLDKNGLVQFPTVIGGVVPVVNIDGIEPGKLKLNGDVLAKIYLGEISKWNDPQLVKLNPDLKLPDANITTVFRSDGSGTSFVFTTYLSQASAAWKDKVGASTTVQWPTSKTGAAGKGNAGVATYVDRVKNSIGYVEYAYAKQNNMAYTQMQNQAGNYVSPTPETFAAAADTDWSKAPGFNLVLTNQAGAQAWPIASATFILVHKQADDAAKTKAVLSFFDWAFKQGDGAAGKLDYVALPANVKDLIRQEWKQITDASGKAVY